MLRYILVLACCSTGLHSIPQQVYTKDDFSYKKQALTIANKTQHTVKAYIISMPSNEKALQQGLPPITLFEEHGHLKVDSAPGMPELRNFTVATVNPGQQEIFFVSGAPVSIVFPNKEIPLKHPSLHTSDITKGSQQLRKLPLYDKVEEVTKRPNAYLRITPSYSISIIRY